MIDLALCEYACPTFLDTGVAPERLPAWLTETDLGFFVSEFERTGFRGALNWYRTSTHSGS